MGHPYTNIPTTHLTKTNQPPKHALASFQNGLGCTLLQHHASRALPTSLTPRQREIICGACIPTSYYIACALTVLIVSSVHVGFFFFLLASNPRILTSPPTFEGKWPWPQVLSRSLSWKRKRGGSEKKKRNEKKKDKKKRREKKEENERKRGGEKKGKKQKKEEKERKGIKCQTQLLHCFSKRDNKSNHHHHSFSGWACDLLFRSRRSLRPGSARRRIARRVSRFTVALRYWDVVEYSTDFVRARTIGDHYWSSQ